jgi:hypothetical protein
VTGHTTHGDAKRAVLPSRTERRQEDSQMMDNEVFRAVAVVSRKPCAAHRLASR